MIEVFHIKTELLPCPFCGFKPDVMEPDCVYPLTRNKSLWRAGCYETGGGCGAEVLGGNALEAIKNWNTRTKC